MNQFRKLFLTLLCLFTLFFNQNIFAQSTSSERELGLRFTGVNDFGFVYKKAKTADKFKRYRLAIFNTQYQRFDETSLFNFQFGFAIGTEKRVEIAEDLLFIHGLEPALQIVGNSQEDILNMNIVPSLGYVLGFQHNPSKKFGISIETIPAISAAFRIRDDELNNADSFSILAGFNSNAVALSLVYRFEGS